MLQIPTLPQPGTLTGDPAQDDPAFRALLESTPELARFHAATRPPAGGAAQSAAASGPAVGWQYVQDDSDPRGHAWRDTLGRLHYGPITSRPWERDWWNTGVVRPPPPAPVEPFYQFKTAEQLAAAHRRAPRGWTFVDRGRDEVNSWSGPDGKSYPGTIDARPWDAVFIPVDPMTGREAVVPADWEFVNRGLGTEGWRDPEGTIHYGGPNTAPWTNWRPKRMEHDTDSPAALDGTRAEGSPAPGSAAAGTPAPLNQARTPGVTAVRSAGGRSRALYVVAAIAIAAVAWYVWRKVRRG